MRNFEYFTPTRVIFGKDTHLKIGTVLKEQNCSKVLIHYGSHSAVSSGLIDEIRSSLDESRDLLCHSWRCGSQSPSL